MDGKDIGWCLGWLCDFDGENSRIILGDKQMDLGMGGEYFCQIIDYIYFGKGGNLKSKILIMLYFWCVVD